MSNCKYMHKLLITCLRVLRQKYSKSCIRVSPFEPSCSSSSSAIASYSCLGCAQSPAAAQSRVTSAACKDCKLQFRISNAVWEGIASYKLKESHELKKRRGGFRVCGAARVATATNYSLQLQQISLGTYRLYSVVWL